jgi:hypothetical protein
VSVVLIDNSVPSPAAPPVLARGPGGTGPVAGTAFPPVISQILPPNGLPAARPGDQVRLLGTNLGGVSSVQVTGARLTAAQTLAVAAVGDTSVTVTIPAAGTLLPAGTVLLTPLAPALEAPGNTVALALAPTLVIKKPPLKAKLINGAATVAVGCSPPITSGQPVALIVGDHIVAGPTPTATTSTLSFALSGFTKGNYILRLRVDGQDSIPIDVNNPLAFDPNQTLVLTT